MKLYIIYRNLIQYSQQCQGLLYGLPVNIASYVVVQKYFLKHYFVNDNTEWKLDYITHYAGMAAN